MAKRITSCDLARICGVSQGTVDRALNNRPGIRRETKARILEAAAAYGYFPSVYASKLAGGRSTLIGVVVFDLKNEYFSELVYAIDTACRRMGCASVTMFSGKDATTELACIQKLITLGVDGLILCPINPTEALAPLRAVSLPTVTVGNRAEGFPYCGIDDKIAMAALTRRAIEDGHTPIYYSPALAAVDACNVSAQRLRYDGYLHAMCEAERAPRLCTDKESLACALKETSSSPALVCSTDYYALSILGSYPSLPLYSFDGTHTLPLLHPETVTVGTDAARVADESLRLLLTPSAQDRAPMQLLLLHTLGG